MAFDIPYGGNEGVQEVVIEVEVTVIHGGRFGMTSRILYQPSCRGRYGVDQMPAGQLLPEIAHDACGCVLAEIEQRLLHLPRAVLQVVGSIVHVSSGQLSVTAGFAARSAAVLLCQPLA